jgi:hypothetical protein
VVGKFVFKCVFNISLFTCATCITLKTSLRLNYSNFDECEQTSSVQYNW